MSMKRTCAISSAISFLTSAAISYFDEDSPLASFWKRGSLRSGSNIGSSRSSAGVTGIPSVASGPAYGIESSFCKAAMARSGSPVRAATRARISIGAGQGVLLDRNCGYRLLDEREGRSLVTKAHIGQCEIAKKTKIFRLVFEERFQFAARLSPTFLGSGMIAGDVLRPA